MDYGSLSFERIEKEGSILLHLLCIKRSIRERSV